MKAKNITSPAHSKKENTGEKNYPDSASIMSNELIELAKKDKVQEKDSTQNQHGCASMHRVPVEGDGEMIHCLGKLDPQTGRVVEDNRLTTPLHRAAVNGDTGEIREIACSESLAKLTSDDETALILAVKNSQIDDFKILVEEAKRHNREHLFNATDKEGNSLLHLAALNKLIVVSSPRSLTLAKLGKSHTTFRANFKASEN